LRDLDQQWRGQNFDLFLFLPCSPVSPAAPSAAPYTTMDSHGCCAVPKGSCKGRAAQITSILGLITASIFLIINLIWWTLVFAAIFIRIGLPGMGVGIYLQFFGILLSIIAYSLALCCCTGERGWKCTAVFLGILSAIYVLAIACIAISHGRLDEMIDEHCKDADDDCDDDGLHTIFGVMYACVFINLAFSSASAYLLHKASPDWAGQGAGADAPPVVTAAAVDVELANTKA